MSNGAWLASKTSKIPNISVGEFITTLTYSNLQINVSLTERDFDPYAQ